MQNYLAKYIPRRATAGMEPYYRTITGAEDLNDAIKQAEKWARKGFIMVGVQSQS